MEENLSSALRLAGAVLLFVLGLSIVVLSYSRARESLDAILAYTDRETWTIENNDRYYYLSNDNDTSRYVGIETIIPTIYRAYKENYKIVFEFPDDYYIFYKKVNGVDTPVTVIDLEQESLANDLKSRKFLDGIIYGKFDYEPGKIPLDYQKEFNIVPNNEINLYEYLIDKEASYKIEECLGVYDENDISSGDTTSTYTGGTTSDSEELSKKDPITIEKRIITYKFKPL